MAAAVGVIPLTLRLCGRGLLPPATILRERIFREAQRLLLYATPTVAETAAHLSFLDAAYFTRLFSKYAGCSSRGLRAGKGVVTVEDMPGQAWIREW